MRDRGGRARRVIRELREKKKQMEEGRKKRGKGRQTEGG